VIGGKNYDSLVSNFGLVQRIQHHPNAVVELACHGAIGGHVGAGFGRVGQGSGWAQAVGVVVRTDVREVAVRLEEADIHKEGLLGRVLDKADGGGSDVVDEGAFFGRDDLVEAKLGAVVVQVLQASKDGMIAVGV